MKIFKNSKFKVLIFIFLYAYIFVINNLFYTSTFSADYQKYIIYLEYFYNYSNFSFLDQGTAYYAIVAIVLNFFSQYTSPATLQFDISFAIQLTNNLLILLGLFGIYNLTKQLEVDKAKMLNILIIINFFPPLQSLKLSMKPEVLVFALLPWLIFLLKQFLEEEKKLYVFAAIIPFALIITTKGTGLVISGLFILYTFFEIIKKLGLKQIIVLTLISFFVILPLLVENTNINNNLFLERTDVTENYKHKASIDILYKNTQGKRVSSPIGSLQTSTVLGVTLLDTFDDYFLLNWNKDVSLFKKFRKNIIEPNKDVQLIKVDFKNREILYNGPLKNSIQNLRIYLGLIFTVVFYILILRYKDKETVNKRIVLSPIIGILVLYIHSLGVPYEDFDPLVADTFKTFYYSPFLIISFSFLLAKYFKNNKKNISILLIFLISSLYIYGFPKKDSSEYLGNIDELNRNNVLCELNIYIINDLKQNKDSCTNKKIEFCKYYINKQNTELETSRFLIEKNVSSINKDYEAYDDCINNIKVPKLMAFNRLPVFNLSVFLIFLLYLSIILRLDNSPAGIRMSKN